LIGSIEIAPEKARIGVLTYAENATILVHLKDYTEEYAGYDVLNYVADSMSRYDGSENVSIAAALEAVRTQMFTAANGDRPGKGRRIRGIIAQLVHQSTAYRC
jgi:hypothetical protein